MAKFIDSLEPFLADTIGPLEEHQTKFPNILVSGLGGDLIARMYV